MSSRQERANAVLARLAQRSGVVADESVDAAPQHFAAPISTTVGNFEKPIKPTSKPASASDRRALVQQAYTSNDDDLLSMSVCG
jgi:hypothetical protein